MNFTYFYYSDAAVHTEHSGGDWQPRTDMRLWAHSRRILSICPSESPSSSSGPRSLHMGTRWGIWSTGLFDL